MKSAWLLNMIRTANLKARSRRLRKSSPPNAAVELLEDRALLCDWVPTLGVPDAAIGNDIHSAELSESAQRQELISGNGHVNYFDRFCGFPGAQLHSNIDQPGDVDVVSFRIGQNGRIRWNTLAPLGQLDEGTRGAGYQHDPLVTLEFLDAQGNILSPENNGVTVLAGETIYLRVTASEENYTGEYAVDFWHSIDYTRIRESSLRDYRDLDGDGTVSPLTDGVMLARYFAGMRGDTLTENAINPDGIRNSPQEVEMWLLFHDHLLDADGDNETNPLTDGILHMREMAGFSGETLVENSVNVEGIRPTAEEISQYLNSVIQELPGCEEFCSQPEQGGGAASVSNTHLRRRARQAAGTTRAGSAAAVHRTDDHACRWFFDCRVATHHGSVVSQTGDGQRHGQMAAAHALRSTSRNSRAH